MLIRTATGDDVEAMAALSGELGYPARAGDVGRRLSKITVAGDHGVFVAQASGGRVVGWIHVFEALRLESEPFAEIGGLVVAEARRGRGVGRLLCERAGRWARDHGLAALRVRTRTERGAHRFYERVGFRQTKTQRVLVLRLAREREGRD